MQIYAVGKKDLGPAWLDVVEGRKFVEAICADFGFADAHIALLTFKNPNDAKSYEYEVAHGECLRPYTVHYKGTDADDATAAWLKAVAELEGYTAPEPYEEDDDEE